jgi:hypothetical protein
MSSEMYVYQISKKDLEKDDYLVKQFKDNSLDSVDLTLGEAEGFKLVWISPRLGNLWDGLGKHAPGLQTSRVCQITKEQVVGILEVSRDVAEKDKGEFQDPSFFDYLLSEFNEFETLVTEFDLENNHLFAYTN